MEEIEIRKAIKLLNIKEEIIKSKDEIIEILRRENKALQERIEELEK